MVWSILPAKDGEAWPWRSTSMMAQRSEEQQPLGKSPSQRLQQFLRMPSFGGFRERREDQIDQVNVRETLIQLLQLGFAACAADPEDILSLVQTTLAPSDASALKGLSGKFVAELASRNGNCGSSAGSLDNSVEAIVQAYLSSALDEGCKPTEEALTAVDISGVEAEDKDVVGYRESYEKGPAYWSEKSDDKEVNQTMPGSPKSGNSGKATSSTAFAGSDDLEDIGPAGPARPLRKTWHNSLGPSSGGYSSLISVPTRVSTRWPTTHSNVSDGASLVSVAESGGEDIGRGCARKQSSQHSSTSSGVIRSMLRRRADKSDAVTTGDLKWSKDGCPVEDATNEQWAEQSKLLVLRYRMGGSYQSSVASTCCHRVSTTSSAWSPTFRTSRSSDITRSEVLYPCPGKASPDRLSEAQSSTSTAVFGRFLHERSLLMYVVRASKESIRSTTTGLPPRGQQRFERKEVVAGSALPEEQAQQDAQGDVEARSRIEAFKVTGESTDDVANTQAQPELRSASMITECEHITSEISTRMLYEELFGSRKCGSVSTVISADGTADAPAIGCMSSAPGCLPVGKRGSVRASTTGSRIAQEDIVELAMIAEEQTAVQEDHSVLSEALELDLDEVEREVDQKSRWLARKERRLMTRQDSTGKMTYGKFLRQDSSSDHLPIGPSSTWSPAAATLREEPEVAVIAANECGVLEEIRHPSGQRAVFARRKSASDSLLGEAQAVRQEWLKLSRWPCRGRPCSPLPVVPPLPGVPTEDAPVGMPCGEDGHPQQHLMAEGEIVRRSWTQEQDNKPQAAPEGDCVQRSRTKE